MEFYECSINRFYENLKKDVGKIWFLRCSPQFLKLQLKAHWNWHQKKGKKKGKKREKKGKREEMSEISKHRWGSVQNLFLSRSPPHFVRYSIIYPQKGSIGKKQIIRSLDIFRRVQTLKMFKIEVKSRPRVRAQPERWGVVWTRKRARRVSLSWGKYRARRARCLRWK